MKMVLNTIKRTERYRLNKQGWCPIMVWIFILLTAVTYSFVMKYVLSHIQKTVKVINAATPDNENGKEVASLHAVR